MHLYIKTVLLSSPSQHLKRLNTLVSVCLKELILGMTTSITLNRQKLEEVDSFKYLGSTLAKDGSSTRKSNSLSFPVTLLLFKSLVVSVLLYGCERWTLTADLKRRIQAFEHTCYRRLLRISYTEYRTNEFVRQQVSNYGLPWLTGTTPCHGHATETGHISGQDSLARIIMLGTVEGKQSRGAGWKGPLLGCCIHRVTSTSVYDAHGTEVEETIYF